MSALEELERQLRETREQFLQLVVEIRPSLHKYCARMSGSVFDGEDLVQETLAQAYYKLSMFRQDLPLKPWLFKIAHNKCVDFLRSRQPQVIPWEEETPEDSSEDVDLLEQQELTREAWASLLTLLPPKERACVVLKDILDQSLAEIAETLDTPLAAVKIALHRGRQKLRTRTRAQPAGPPRIHAEQLARYVELFNQRDWEGVKHLLTAETQCEVMGAFSGRGRDVIAGNYLRTLAGLGAWSMSCLEIEDEAVIVRWHRVDGTWHPRGLTRIEWAGKTVSRIRDYTHAPYLLAEVAWQGHEPKNEPFHPR